MQGTAIERAQSFMRVGGIDAWLVHDFRMNNHALPMLLPPASGTKRWTTRRCDLFIPASGRPTLLVHAIDAGQFEHAGDMGIDRRVFLTWREWQEGIRGLVRGKKVAMEYAPENALPVVGIVDAGTVELVRSSAAEVVSSADLMQACVAVWTPQAVERHAEASRQVDLIKDRAFDLIRQALARGRSIHEHEVVGAIHGWFREAGLEWPDGPIVAVNAHAADPHYEPAESRPTPIRPGDWILLDLWARTPGEENIFADITWVAFAGREPDEEHRRVFEVVKAARDAAVSLARRAWERGEQVRGWQLDEAARGVIVDAGFGHAVKHRTGHSLSPGQFVHGVGMNLDNLETHDTRLMLPGIGFTVEPGVYLDGRFGVRLEINVYVDPRRGPVVTSRVQDRIVTLI